MKRLVLTTVSLVIALALSATTALGQSARHGRLTSTRTVRESGKPVLGPVKFTWLWENTCELPLRTNRKSRWCCRWSC